MVGLERWSPKSWS